MFAALVQIPTTSAFATASAWAFSTCPSLASRTASPTARASSATAIRRTPADTPHRADKRKLPATVPETSIDPLSLSFRIARSVAEGRGCNGTHFIFDGNRRYDLMFSDLGVSKLPYTPYSVYSGNARRCQFDMKRISGFREPREFIRFWDEDNLDPPRIWVARVVPEMPPVPVRLEGDLNMGGLRIYLVWAEFAGAPVFPNGVKPDVRVARNP